MDSLIGFCAVTTVFAISGKASYGFESFKMLSCVVSTAAPSRIESWIGGSYRPGLLLGSLFSIESASRWSNFAKMLFLYDGSFLAVGMSMITSSSALASKV